MKKSGIPVVISAPSGAGKSTIAANVIKQHPSGIQSISCTTRAPRAGEKNGQDYFFISDQQFNEKIEKGEFLEWAVVHNNHYGTPLSYLEEQLAAKKDVILTIDPQGAMAVKSIYPNGIFIFVVPPTWEILVNRLTKRATDDKASLDTRIANARKELTYLSHYDYLVINDDLDVAVKNVLAIIQSEHQRLVRIDLDAVPILSHN